MIVIKIQLIVQLYALGLLFFNTVSESKHTMYKYVGGGRDTGRERDGEKDREGGRE